MKYIIDGYNMLRHPLFNSYLSENPEDTVKAIVPALKEEAGVNFIIVFDGKFEIPPDLINFVRTSGKSQDADSYIVNLLLREGTENKIVVTNDVHLSMRIRSIGGRVISVEEFFQIVRKKRSRISKRIVTKDGMSKKEMDEINRELKELWGIE